MNLTSEIKALGVEIAEQARQRTKPQDEAPPPTEEVSCVRRWCTINKRLYNNGLDSEILA